MAKRIHGLNPAPVLAGVLALLAGVPGAAVAASAPKDQPSARIDFIRDIRPILSDNCFACHGPDDQQRKGKLRLDVREAAVMPAKSGETAIVPGDTAKSELVKRILATDPDEVMPPPKTKKKLTASQIDLLQRWVASGAGYAGHWAFVKPERPAPPPVKDDKWARSDLDKFVLARLEKEGLNPAPEADKTTLIRRVSLDLTGLPPTLKEVDEFLADKSPDAYEKLVSRLLNSPRFGENMARYWLDAARYADSHGFHIDSERSIWKWREWVIEAFNQNMPFDQFTVEQLAGDLLPEPTSAQKIASGYVRCNMSTGEGGAIVEEYQAKYSFDRVETSGTIWMGMTFLCCRCHTHKYDPITHREYYGLFSFFNNLNESVMDGNKPNPDPSMRVPSPQQTQRLAELKKHMEDGQAKLDAPMPKLDKAQAAWQARWHDKLSRGWTTLEPAVAKSTLTNGATLRVVDGQSVLAEGNNPESDTYQVTLKVAPGDLAAVRLETLPHPNFPAQSAARADDGRFRLSEFEAELITPSTNKDAKPKKLKFTQAVADDMEETFEVAKAIDEKADTGWGVATGAAGEGHTALFALAEPVKVPTNSELRVTLRFDASKSKRAIGHFRVAAAQDDALVRLLNPPKLSSWQVLGPFQTEGLAQGYTNVFEPEKKIDLKKAYTGVREEIKWKEKAEFEDGKDNLLVQDLHGLHGAYYLYRTLTVPAARKLDLTIRADDACKLWVNDKLVAQRAEEKPGDGAIKVTVNLQKGENKFLWKVVTVQGAAYFTFNKNLGDTESVPADVAAVLAATKKLTGAQQTRVRNHYRREHSAEFKATFDQVEKWREENGNIDKAIPTTMVAKEMAKPRDTFMLLRGEYDKKGDKVTASLPAIFPPLPAGAPTNRLGFAQWLIDPGHPLTARVTVNRFWQQYFGVGLVKTVEDFGVQGEFPSHPELLDWLATEFIRIGWDMKRMQKLLVTSATYRQSSKAAPELRARDPENRLLARGPRFRVDGEVLRDMALQISGLLVEQRGGRSVKPFEPGGLWEAVSFNNSQKYVQDKGEANYRRSLYTYWKRQSPPANMLLFDAPTREYCVVRRPRTNTPLQALAMLNDPQFVEASRAFATRILREGGKSTTDKLTFGFRLATARKPGAGEVKILESVLREQLAEYRSDQAAARKLTEVGGFRPHTAMDDADLAAWTIIASMILNLDEAVTKG